MAKKYSEKNRQLLGTRNVFGELSSREKRARTHTHTHTHIYAALHAKTHKHWCWPADSLGSILHCPEFSPLTLHYALHLYNKRSAQSPRQTEQILTSPAPRIVDIRL